MPNPVNYKLAFVLFKKAFDLLLQDKDNKTIYIQPDKTIIQLLNEDPNLTKSKIEPIILTVSLMSLIGMPLTERTIRSNFKINFESLSDEIRSIQANSFKNIDATLSTFMAERPKELFESDGMIENSLGEMRRSILTARVNI